MHRKAPRRRRTAPPPAHPNNNDGRRSRTLAIAPALALSLAATACHRATTPAPRPHAGAAPAAVFPATWRYHAPPSGTRAPHAMVASNSAIASEAGLEILRRGGNAVDAAVAVGFALAVAYPEAGNIGGGGYMVIRMADGRVAALDYREVAPRAATRDMYLDASGRIIPRQSTQGYLASGVPGSVAGMAAALRRYGTLPLSAVMQPAIRLAADGFIVDTGFARSIDDYRELISRFAGAEVFLPDGHPPAVGSRIVQPTLARTLRLIAAQGPDAFYRGEIADSIVAEEHRGGGPITREDLGRYAPEWREPLRGIYRGDTLYAMPPSSSGGVTVIEILNILERFAPLPPAGSAAWAHLVAEAERRAFVDRNTQLGDPAFVRNPTAELTSKTYAESLAASIEPARATPSPVFHTAGTEGMHTTHYSVVDSRGNAVATTTTINDLYGSGVYVRGAGFFLNDEMDDFTSRPGQPNLYGLIQGEQNAIAPGKRPLSAMSPTIVVDHTGRVKLVLGSRGGPRIITSVAEVLLNVLDARMPLGAALAAPRIHHQAWPDSLRYEEDGLSPAVVDSLRAMGYAPYVGDDFIGRVIAIGREEGEWVGVVDPRTGGGAVGY